MIEQLDINTAIEQLDISTAIEQLDINTAIEQLDISTAIEQLDISTAIEQLDISTAIEQLLKVEVVPSCRSVLIDSALTDVKLLLSNENTATLLKEGMVHTFHVKRLQ